MLDICALCDLEPMCIERNSKCMALILAEAEREVYQSEIARLTAELDGDEPEAAN